MKRIFLTVVLLSLSTTAVAGIPVYGVDKDLGVALDKAVTALEKAAAVHGTCVSRYPSLETCNEVKGYWQCSGMRANWKGSCASRPSDLDTLIQAANGLSGPAAKAAAAAKVSP
ncbi:hypothetical protein BV378_14280 [Nostoc sp. RF31YmG]|jgi:hypothetical protein|nr:hypothetical protein BV378_14280 [Nostoc sp. RF31YmG]